MIIDAFKSKIKEHLNFNSLEDGDPLIVIAPHDEHQFKFYKVKAKDFDDFDFTQMYEIGSIYGFPLQSNSVKGVIFYEALGFAVNRIKKVIEEAERISQMHYRVVLVEEIAPSPHLHSEFYKLHTIRKNRLLFNYDMAYSSFLRFDKFKWEEIILANRTYSEYFDNSPKAEEYALINGLSGAFKRNVSYEERHGNIFLSRKFILASGEYFNNEGFLNIGWWDGPDRFQRINRNVVSSIQRELFYKLVVTLAPGKIGWDMGGPGCEVLGVKIKGLNVYRGQDLTADASDTPFEDSSIDFIVSFHTIEHIKNTKKLFREWQRILKPKGIIGFVMPDVRYFLHHDTPNMPENDKAPSEMSADTCLNLIKEAMPKMEILFFNTLQNNFEFEGVLRKKEVI